MVWKLSGFGQGVAEGIMRGEWAEECDRVAVFAVCATCAGDECDRGREPEGDQGSRCEGIYCRGADGGDPKIPKGCLHGDEGR